MKSNKPFYVRARMEGMARYSSYQAPFNRGSIETISECQIIDAQDITTGPIAIFIIPYRMPCGFHAGWVSAE